MPDLRFPDSDEDRDLRELFVSSPLPSLAVDPDAVLTGGRRRVRRRRGVVGGATTLAAAATIGVVLTSTGGLGLRTATDAAAPAPGAVTATVSAGTSPSPASAPGSGGTVPALPEPSGSCTTSMASMASGVAGEPTPYAAARTVRLQGFDARGAWREANRTATSAELYKDGVWVRTITTTKGGWVVEKTTQCPGYTPPSLPAPVPETATSRDDSTGGAPITSKGVSTWVHLSGDPQWPDVRLDSTGAAGTTRAQATYDPSFVVKGVDARAYRTATGAVVVLVPTGDQGSVALGVKELAPGTAGGTAVGIGRLQYAAQLLGPKAAAGDVTAVYRESGYGNFASSTGDRAVQTEFSGLMSPHLAYFRKDGFALVRVGPALATASVHALPSWGALDVDADGEQRHLAILPAGSKDVLAPDLPGFTVTTQGADGLVVVLVDGASASVDATKGPGRLQWTDAQGAHWEMPAGGTARRLS